MNSQAHQSVRADCPKPAPGQAMVNTALGLVTPACAETLTRLAAIDGYFASEKAAALVAFCVELGATLEAEVAS